MSQGGPLATPFTWVSSWEGEFGRQEGVYRRGRRQHRAQKRGSQAGLASSSVCGLRLHRDATFREKSFCAELRPCPSLVPSGPSHHPALRGNSWQSGAGPACQCPTKPAVQYFDCPPSQVTGKKDDMACACALSRTLNALGSQGYKRRFYGPSMPRPPLWSLPLTTLLCFHFNTSHPRAFAYIVLPPCFSTPPHPHSSLIDQCKYYLFGK